jgi:hypothetical protein
MMAKRAAAKTPAPPVPKGAGDAPTNTEIEITGSNEVWSEYHLIDGTRLRIRPVLVSAFRAEGQWMPDGEPVYGVKLTFITDIQAPTALKKKIT